MHYGEFVGKCTAALNRIEAIATWARKGSRNGDIQCDTLRGGCSLCATLTIQTLRDTAAELEAALEEWNREGQYWNKKGYYGD